MNKPNDNVKFLLTILYAAWVLTFLYSFVAYTRAPYEGAGFPDGLNKMAVFFGWQGIAGVLALGVFAVSLQWPRHSGVRQISGLPLFLAALVLAGLTFLVVWAGGISI